MFKLNIIFLFLFSTPLVFCQKSPKYEMRGLWVATVKNIDWPSKPGLPDESQKREAIAILDKAASLHFNAIFLQVRPSSDALYLSKLEPLSPYLTGHKNQTEYDPLTFWIEQAHQRGIELHAWINPFRATMSVNDPLPPDHPVAKHPEWFVVYNGRHQYDPGIPQCRQHITAVVADIVERYDIDGIHLDDYFYPYPKASEEFCDNISFETLNPNGISDKNAWRRSNVDTTIVMLRQAVKSRKSQVAFGVSPFGVWRNIADDPMGSDTRAGITNFDHLHADILLWLREGWIDYVAPQIYWDTNHASANFTILANWWARHSYGKPIFIGHSLYRVNNDPAPWDNPRQILDQVAIIRQLEPIKGSIYFSANHLNRNLKGLQDSLTVTYKHPAITPRLVAPLEPISAPIAFKMTKRGSRLKWKVKPKDFRPYKYIVYAYESTEDLPENNGANIVSITNENQIRLAKQTFSGKTLYFKISAIDKYKQEILLGYPKRIRFK